VEIERAPRAVTVHAFELTSWSPPARATFRILCSKGTYVRSLAADLGQALGVGAHLTSLRRTLSGPFALDRAITLEALADLVTARAALPLVPLATALGHLPGLTVNADVVLAVTQGKRLTPQALGAPIDLSGRIRVLRPDGSLLAIADLVEGSVLSRRVFGAWVPPVANTPSPLVTFSSASG
jgi:tRNA pseudouridine55 synthase